MMRPTKSRSTARQKARIDAALYFVQHALLYLAIALRLCEDPWITVFSLLCALALFTAFDFFFGGFLPQKHLIIVKTAIFTIICFVITLLTSGVGTAFAAAAVSAVSSAAVYAFNLRCAGLAQSSPAKNACARLAAAVIALAVYNI